MAYVAQPSYENREREIPHIRNRASQEYNNASHLKNSGFTANKLHVVINLDFSGIETNHFFFLSHIGDKQHTLDYGKIL